MLIDEFINVTTNSKNLKYYQEKGYICTTTKEIINIKICDLPKYSKQLINIKCDYCGIEYKVPFGDWNNKTKIINKDCCKQCIPLKRKESCIQTYGVENVFQLENMQNKIKNTIFEKYGVDNVSQLKEIQDKIKENNLIKYSVTNTSMLSDNRDKMKETNLKKYGVEAITQLESCQKQIEETSMKKYGTKRPMQSQIVKDNHKRSIFEKYGVEYIGESKEVIAKRLNTRYKNGNHMSSKPQNELYGFVGGELNYPCDNFIIDIALIQDNIAIEYNGSGHDLSVRLNRISREKFDRNENFRRKVLYKNNYRIITFISQKDKNFSEEITLKLINYCKNLFSTNNKHWVEIYIDTNILKCSSFEININDII